MKRESAEAGRYIQAVSRFFLEQRGAPFFLSSKEVENIKDWRKLGIPLQIVLEGIKDCFAYHRKKPGRKNKILSLAFCHSFVLRGFAAHKERKVGGQDKPFPKDDKRKKLKSAVERFLAHCPEISPDLKAIFSHVLQLTSKSFEEEVLERLETKVETLVVELATEEEREKVRKEVMMEFGEKNSQEQERIRTLKLIRYIREKYGIPHVSLYYY